MTVASDSSYPTPFSPDEKIEEPLLELTNSQPEADQCCPASSPQIANPASPGKGTPVTLRTPCPEPKKHRKRGRSKYSTLVTVVRGLPRSKILDCLKTHWETLKVEGIFAMPSHLVFTWTLGGSSEQVRRLHHHLILRHLDVKDDHKQWRRLIDRGGNLDGYTSFSSSDRCRASKGLDYKHEYSPIDTTHLMTWVLKLEGVRIGGGVRIGMGCQNWRKVSQLDVSMLIHI